MESRIDKAVSLKRTGQYNCAQSVACAFHDLTGQDERTLYDATGAFGAGMGCTEGTCGALVGAGIALSLIRKDRVRAMQDMKLIVGQFLQRNGSIVCKELKGIESGTALRACNDCVADAAGLLTAVLRD